MLTDLKINNLYNIFKNTMSTVIETLILGSLIYNIGAPGDATTFFYTFPSGSGGGSFVMNTKKLDLDVGRSNYYISEFRDNSSGDLLASVDYSRLVKRRIQIDQLIQITVTINTEVRRTVIYNPNLPGGYAFVSPNSPLTFVVSIVHPAAPGWLHANSAILLDGNTTVLAKDLRSAPTTKYLVDQFGNSVELKLHVRGILAIQYILIKKDTFYPNVPSSDLMITQDHPILVNGVEVQPIDLIDGVNIYFVDVTGSCYAPVTENGTFVMVNNIPVATWSTADFQEQVIDIGTEYIEL